MNFYTDNNRLYFKLAFCHVSYACLYNQTSGLTLTASEKCLKRNYHWYVSRTKTLSLICQQNKDTLQIF